MFGYHNNDKIENKFFCLSDIVSQWSRKIFTYNAHTLSATLPLFLEIDKFSMDDVIFSDNENREARANELIRDNQYLVNNITKYKSDIEDGLKNLDKILQKIRTMFP